MEENTISLIIPMFNCENFIKRCIESLKEQVYTGYEAIIINDGSTDRSYEMCKTAIDGDERFVLVNKSNTGVADTRNQGLAMAKGEYIVFVDADDWVSKDYLSSLIHAKNKTDADIVCGGYYVSDGENVKKSLILPERELSISEALDGFSRYYFSSVWGKLFDKRILNGITFRKDLFYSEDTLFYTMAVLNSKKIAWINNANYFYYENSLGAMKKKDPYKYISEFIARKEIVYLYEKANIPLIGAEYWLYEAAVNVKITLYRNRIFDEHCICELNDVIKKYRWTFRKKYKTFIKSFLVNILYSR